MSLTVLRKGGSIIVKQLGHATLTVNLPDGKKMEYLITLPRLRIDGLWWVLCTDRTVHSLTQCRYGSPYIELAESSYIIGGGYISVIEYKGKGYFSGKSHSFKAIVTGDAAAFSPSSTRGPTGNEFVIEGTWHQNSKFSTGLEFHNVLGAKEEVTAVGGASDGTMGEFETRKLWSAVAQGIREGDFETASKEKGRIEVCTCDVIGVHHLQLAPKNDQRQRRKDEAAAGSTWPLKHFIPVASDAVCTFSSFSFIRSDG